MYHPRGYVTRLKFSWNNAKYITHKSFSLIPEMKMFLMLVCSVKSYSELGIFFFTCKLNFLEHLQQIFFLKNVLQDTIFFSLSTIQD